MSASPIIDSVETEGKTRERKKQNKEIGVKHVGAVRRGCCTISKLQQQIIKITATEIVPCHLAIENLLREMVCVFVRVRARAVCAVHVACVFVCTSTNKCSTACQQLVKHVSTCELSRIFMYAASVSMIVLSYSFRDATLRASESLMRDSLQFVFVCVRERSVCACLLVCVFVCVCVCVCVCV